VRKVFEALYALFAADTNFKAAVGGQFYPGIVDQDRATFPYAAYYLINDDSDWTFSEDIEYILIQISVYDNSNSQGNILDAYEYLKVLFDDAELSVDGYNFVLMHRQQTTLVRDGIMETWHLTVDYEIEIQRNRLLRTGVMAASESADAAAIAGTVT